MMFDFLGKFSLEELFVIISTPIYIGLIGMEILLSNWQHRKLYNLRDCITNALFMLFNGGIDLMFRVVYLGVLGWAFSHRIAEPVSNPYLYWILLFIAEDFAFYILHYVDHHCRLFWAVHVTHHSSEHFNFTTGFRSSVFQPLYRFIYFIPIALAGFHPADIILMYSVTQIYGIIVHTRLVDKLGWLEYILVTPSHHRVHHASNVVYLDKNMGMCLIIWDKLFGTFQEELPNDPPRYGLTKAPSSQSLPHMLLHEWKDLFLDLKKPLSFREKWNYVFKPPGWSHDGSRQTSKELQARQNELQKTD